MEAIGEDGSLDLHRTRPVEEVRTGYTYFEDGDVAFAKVTPCFENGKGALMKGLERQAGFGTSELTVLRPKTGTNARYLNFVVQSEQFRQLGAGAMTGAGGLKRVPDEFTRNFRATFPSEEEQERIANFLDEQTARIDALIVGKDELLDKLFEYRIAIVETVMADAPGQSRVRLGLHVDLLPGYAFPSEKFSLDPDGIPLLRGINMAPGCIRWDETVYWPHTDDATLERFRLKASDVVFGMDRPWVNAGTRVAMVDEDAEDVLLLQRVCRLRGGSKFHQRFIYYALASDRFRQSVEVDLTGVSVPHISPEQILSFKVPAISFEEQRDRCEEADRKVSSIDELTMHASQVIDRLREYRSSLISAAVTGQIDINNFQMEVV